MMLFFWVAAILLAGALLFLLPPLFGRGITLGSDARSLTLSLYRDAAAQLQADLEDGTLSPELYDEARRELELRLLEDMPKSAATTTASRYGRLAAWGLLLALPLAAAGLYLLVGTPEALRLNETKEEAATGGHPVTQQDLTGMITRLSARLQQNPNDVAAWAMMGRTYTMLGRFGDAIAAFEKAVALDDSDPGLLVDYADVLAATRGKELGGQPAELLFKALALDPNHPKALALAGTAAFNAKQYTQAVEYWERLLRLMVPGSDAARGVAGSIAEAKARAAGGPAAGPQVAGATLSGVVRLHASLAAKIQPTDTVFIFARAAQGPPMPLAVLRRHVSDLPVSFTLDDSMAMAPGMKLSSFPQVVVGARISHSGQPTPSSGDLQGLSTPVQLGASNLEIVIDSVLP